MSLGRGLGSLISKKTPVLNQQNNAVVAVENDDEKIIRIPVEQIEENPYQPRKIFDPKDLQDLVESIKIYGVIQPLIVSKISDNKYQLIAGERRLRASKQAGLQTVPAIVRDVKKQEKLELALIENVQRQNLNPIEEAFSYKRLMDEFNLTQDEVSKKLGKSRPAVANTVRLLELPQKVQDALQQGKITAGHARSILTFGTEQERMNFFDKILLHNFTVRDAEKHSKKVNIKGHQREFDPLISQVKQDLRQALGTKIDIDSKKGKGKIVIHFFSNEELAEIVKKIVE